MITISGYDFPETKEEDHKWRRVVLVKALHRQVLVVARTRIEGAWAAYCFPVPGMNHAGEIYLWETEGAKLEQKFAEAMFPSFAKLHYTS